MLPRVDQCAIFSGDFFFFLSFCFLLMSFKTGLDICCIFSLNCKLNIAGWMFSEYRSQIWKRDPRTPIPLRHPWSSNWGYLGFCRPHMWKQTQTKCVHDLRAPCGASCVFTVTLWEQYIHTWQIYGYLDRGKNPKYPKLEPLARIKMGQVLGSPDYICGIGANWSEYGRYQHKCRFFK